MTTQSSDIAENAAELAHLQAVARRLSDADLACPLEAGWTVASVLVHLAFFDRRARLLIEKWKTTGAGPSPLDTDLINEVARTFFLAVPPRAALQMTLAEAEAVDAEIARLSPELEADIQANGKPVRLNRAHHRRDHLGQIERALGWTA